MCRLVKPLVLALWVGLLGSTPALADLPTESPTTTGDPAVGATLAEGCASCHSFETEGKQKWGPSLDGLLGKPVGMADYRYGPYLRDQRAQGATWTSSTLTSWLGDSKQLAKEAGGRTKMPAQDLTAEEVVHLVSYLATLWDAP